MRTAGTRHVTGGRRLADRSTILFVTIALLVAGFLLSPIGYDLMFRLGVRTGEVVFAWIDEGRTDTALSR